MPATPQPGRELVSYIRATEEEFQSQILQSQNYCREYNVKLVYDGEKGFITVSGKEDNVKLCVRKMKEDKQKLSSESGEPDLASESQPDKKKEGMCAILKVAMKDDEHPSTSQAAGRFLNLTVQSQKDLEKVLLDHFGSKGGMMIPQENWDHDEALKSIAEKLYSAAKERYQDHEGTIELQITQTEEDMFELATVKMTNETEEGMDTVEFEEGWI